MKCKNTYELKDRGIEVNCGSCHPCRVNYTSMWTLRCLYELSSWNSASFITLTYDDEHLPIDFGLHYEDVSLFWKRLRKNLNNYQPNSKIKYYVCGEYGDKEKKYVNSISGGKAIGRPHYHAIVFGLDSFNDDHRQILTDSWTLCDSYMFDKNKKDNGMLDVCREDIAYTCGYVQKKLTGELGSDTYGIRNPPFSHVSQGMGLDFAIKNEERLRMNNFTYLNGKKVGIPRYFRNKLGIDQQSAIKQTKTVEQRQKEIDMLTTLFISDMKKQGTYYPENMTMMSIRFERWYNDFRYSLAKICERDYLQKKQLTSRRYI